MAAATFTLTDGTTTLNLLDKDNTYYMSHEGMRAIRLPRESTRVSIQLSITGTSAANMWANYDALRQMLIDAAERTARRYNPIHELSYQPDGATSASKKYVYDFEFKTSPQEGGIHAKDVPGQRTLRNLVIELVVEPYWRGDTEHALLVNLCDNSDFEWDLITSAAVPTGWTQDGTAADLEGVTQVKIKYGRQAYFWILAAGGTAQSGIYQDVTVDKDTGPYSISVWVTPTDGVARLEVNDGAAGNVDSAVSSGTVQQELKIEGYALTPTTQTTIRIRLLRNADEDATFIWDSVYLLAASTMPKGYIEGYTFDTVDATLMDRQSRTIIAGLEGDVPPLMRLAIENADTDAKQRAYISTRRVVPGVTPLPWILQATDNDSDSADPNWGFEDAVEGAQPDLGAKHIEGNNDAAINTTIICALSQVLSTASPTEATDPKISIRQHRYEVYARLATTVKLISFRVISDSDVVLVEKRNIPATTNSGVDLQWVYLGTAWIPSTSMVNQTDTATDYPMYVMWDNNNDGTADTKLDFIAFFPSDESFCILEQERSLAAPWNRWEWDATASFSKFLVLENITDPGRPHYQTVNDANDPTAPGTHAHWRFRGDIPVVWPNFENHMYIWTEWTDDGAKGNWAIIDQQHRVHFWYVPRFLAPRGD